MKLFIYEHLTSGAFCDQDFSASLYHEGDIMLLMLTQDMLALGYQIEILRDHRLAAPELRDQQTLSIHWIDSQQTYQSEWLQALKANELFLIIAPETDGVLAKLQRQVIEHGKYFLGCSHNTIQLCSDKYKTAQRLHHHSISTPITSSAMAWLEAEHNSDQQWVIKPIDGAGSEETYLFYANQATDFLTKLTPNIQQRFIVQPFIEGETLSLSLFVTDVITCFSVNRQVMQRDGNALKLSHCEVNADTPLTTNQAIAIAQQIYQAMPGLWGFIGVDLIYTPETLWVIDINPRLTSSYAEPAMRRQQNPACYLHQFLQQRHRHYKQEGNNDNGI